MGDCPGVSRLASGVGVGEERAPRAEGAGRPLEWRGRPLLGVKGAAGWSSGNRGCYGVFASGRRASTISLPASAAARFSSWIRS